ncbi:MAG: DUF2294 family protein, partial [Firmicutes bacterium]|nr:DUF2294 family protein [Bacillota bacterium]
MLLKEVREDFEKFLSQLITKGRKYYLGRGPRKVVVLIRRNYLIIELQDFLTLTGWVLLDTELWGVVEHLEEAVANKYYNLFSKFLEAILDIKVLSHCYTLISETKTKSVFFVADRPWEQAEVKIPFQSLDLNTLLERVFFNPKVLPEADKTNHREQVNSEKI